MTPPGGAGHGPLSNGAPFVSPSKAVDCERIIRVTVDERSHPGLTDVVADRMWSWGVRGIEEQTLNDGRQQLSTSVGNHANSITRALASLDPSWSWSVDDVDAHQAADWKRFARPVRCRDDIVVAPAWIDDDDETTEGLTIQIEPGASFGLGDHPTTRSSVRALADELDTRLSAAEAATSILDVGCGSGVLAILAAIAGVPTVRAIDVAGAAVSATIDNAERNGVGGRIDVDDAEIRHLRRPADGYSIIVANILAPILLAVADDLKRLLSDDGALIISGVLSEGHGHGHVHVLKALEPLRPVSTIDDDGWATVTLRAGQSSLNS